MEKSEWFEEWFDTPFYHILYQNRDEEEAAIFIEKLIAVTELKKGAKILDLACGKGRHSIQLNKLGFNVIGIDLSVNSIARAKKYENETLRFAVQDMREAIAGEKFDAIFNLFTSFGYFDEKKDNLKVLNACNQMLPRRGVLVIDFMNVVRSIAELEVVETKIIEGIQFDITRKFDGQHIWKAISFGHNGRSHTYTEKVLAITKEDFEILLKDANFTIKEQFGSYDLSPFDAEKSDRLIIVAVKK